MAFKNDSFAILENCRLRKDQLGLLAIAHSYDTTSSDFVRYKTSYVEISNKFFYRCKVSRSRFPWSLAELVSIYLKDQSGNIVPDETKNIPLLLEIRAKSGDSPVTLVFDTFIGPDKLWKIGNSISSADGNPPISE